MWRLWWRLYSYIATGSNSHLSLISTINFDEYSKLFDSSFNNINSKVSNNKLQYENNLNSYGNNFNSIITNKLNKAKKYLNEITQKINYFEFYKRWNFKKI